MIGYKVSDLMEMADEKSPHYRYRMIANTVNYLMTKFPLKRDLESERKIRELRSRIRKTEDQIRLLTDKLEFQKAKIKKICTHPLLKMEHGGYACSGTSSSGYRHAIHEYVECSICGMTHSFEQEATEEYLND